MRVAYFDAFSGVSGDMTVGALIDAGADAHRLIHGLERLNLGAAYSFEKVVRHGITGTKFHVREGEWQPHTHGDGEIHHHHHQEDQGEAGHAHHHRGLTQILELIDQVHLPSTVKDKAKSVFRNLGEVEANIHGIPVDQVHFHEVGAVDSIADIVGACYGLYLLGVEEVYCSAVNVGSGTAKMAHGVLPIPAPATAALLKEKPIFADGPPFEFTTPTGAAIVSTLAKGFGPMPAMAIQALGYGAGTKDFDARANVLRITIGEKQSVAETQTVVVLEANIDDASPQVLGYAMDVLFAAGALDVTLAPLLMKKNRSGHLLSVVGRPEDREKLAAIVLQETTTLGLRVSSSERRTLPREFVNVETSYGMIRMKVTPAGYAPEYEDCQAIAQAKQVPLKEVIAAANLAYGILKNK